MRRVAALSASIASIVAGCLVGSAAAAAEEVPDAAALRARIDHLIATSVDAKHPAPLGLLRDAVRLSISFGAPAYNNGDHAACGDFYAATTAALVHAFAADGTSTASAAPAIKDLAAAAERAKGIADPDRRAWTLRFGFDQVMMTCAAVESHGQALAHAAGDYFRRDEYEEAELGYAQAATLAAELAGELGDEVPADLRAAAALRGQALLMLGREADAAAAVCAGIPAVPELAQAEIDLHSLYGNRFDFDRRMLELEDWVAKRPQDAAAHVLLGFEHRFGGKRAQGDQDFAAALAIEPKNAAAKLFAPNGGASPSPAAPAEPVP